MNMMAKMTSMPTAASGANHGHEDCQHIQAQSPRALAAGGPLQLVVGDVIHQEMEVAL